MCFCEMFCAFIRQLWCFCQRPVIFLTDSSDGFAERLWSEIVVDTNIIVASIKYFMVVTSRRLTTITITKTKTAGIWFYAITFLPPGRFSFSSAKFRCKQLLINNILIFMYTEIHTKKPARRQKCNCIGAFSGGESLFLGWHGRGLVY